MAMLVFYLDGEELLQSKGQLKLRQKNWFLYYGYGKGYGYRPVILSKAIEINPDDNAQIIHDKLSNITAELLIDAIKGYTSGNLNPIPQENIGIKYANKIDKTEAEIDWEQHSRYS